MVLRGLHAEEPEADSCWQAVRRCLHVHRLGAHLKAGGCLAPWQAGSGQYRGFYLQIRWATAPGSFEISTDAFAPYENAIDAGLHDRASHSNVVKLFSHHVEEGRERYSPGTFVCVQKDAISGSPDLDRASTSHVERKNGTLRQWCKRLTRLTYAFSKKWENLKALALHFAHYNFCRVHGSLRITPAMAAGITDRVWDINEMISVSY